MVRIFFLLTIQSVFGAEKIFSAEKFFPSDVVEVFSDTKTNNFAKIENYPNTNEPAKRFLKSYNSLRPVAVLVDETVESHTAATDFMKDIFRIAPGARQITFFVSKFNSSGTTTLTEIPGDNPEKIYQILSYQINNENSELGHKKSTGSLAFYATLNAVAALPHDGAILIFTDRKINDEDLAGHTGIVRKKNIKVYVVWGGPYPTKTNEERLLKELCKYSGGVFIINGVKDLSNYNYRGFINNNNSTHTNTSIILTKRNLSSDKNFTFPIDSEITCIHLILTPATTKGTLITPTGQHVDVEDNDSIALYGTGSFGVTEQGQREVYLDATQKIGVGLWHLDVRASTSSVPCNVTAFVCTRLTAQAYFARETAGNNVDKDKKKILKVDFTGHLGTVSNITFIDSKGQLLRNEVKYNVMKDFLMMDNDKHNKEIDIEINQIPDQPFQLLIQGTDIKGNSFSRLSYVNDRNYNNNVFPQPILTVDVGIGSELIITGGRSSIITFEVTNLRNVAVDVRFYCKDEKSILGSMQPYRKIIGPQETTIVTVTLSIRTGIYQDLITFAASVGSENIEKKVIVDVGTSQVTSDTTIPYLDYSYLSDCSKVLFSSCEQGTWTIEARAKDTDSGLLQLISIPKGLYFKNGFTTGTKEEVSGTYSDSCCNADLQLIAVDRANNRRTVTVNAYRAMWGPGQIASLILGIVLFILLIVLIVYLIRRCIKKRENYNLPTYRGGRI